MPVDLRVTVRGNAELRRLATDLKRAKGTLRKDTGAALKRAGEKALRKVKTNVETMQIRGFPVPGRKERFTAKLPGTRIRRRISRVTELDVSTGAGNPRIVFRVRSDRLGNARNMPRLLDSGRRFRHPLPGTRKTWAASQGQPWFRKTIIKALPQIRSDVDDAVDGVRRKVEQGR